MYLFQVVWLIKALKTSTRYIWVNHPPFFHIPDRFNLLITAAIAAVDTRTQRSRPIPVVRTTVVIRPERPFSALHRPYAVNTAILPAVVHPQKNTVIRGRFFNQALPYSHPLDILVLEIFQFHSEVFGNDLDLPAAHPDITFGRPRTAPATLLALETKPIYIPAILFNCHPCPARPQPLIALPIVHNSADYLHEFTPLAVCRNKKSSNRVKFCPTRL